jgi:hypothetical protein
MRVSASCRSISGEAMLQLLQQRYSLVCNGKQTDLTPRFSGRVHEVRNPTRERSYPPIQEVDRLNGVDWIGELRYHFLTAQITTSRRLTPPFTFS